MQAENRMEFFSDMLKELCMKEGITTALMLMNHNRF